MAHSMAPVCVGVSLCLSVGLFACACVCRLRLTPLLPPVAPLTHSPWKATAPQMPPPPPPVLRPQLGKDRFVFSMDGNGKIIIAQNSEIQQMNVKTAMEEIVDGGHRRAPEKTGEKGGGELCGPHFPAQSPHIFRSPPTANPPLPGWMGDGAQGDKGEASWSVNRRRHLPTGH